MDSDDDIYEPNEKNEEVKAESNEVKMEDAEGDVEEGEEEEDSSDDDITFITDAKAKSSQPEATSCVPFPYPYFVPLLTSTKTEETTPALYRAPKTLRDASADLESRACFVTEDLHPTTIRWPTRH